MHAFAGEDLLRLGRALFGERWKTPLALHLGVTRGYLLQLEKGDRPITRRMLTKLEHLCDERSRLAEHWQGRISAVRARKAA